MRGLRLGMALAILGMAVLAFSVHGANASWVQPFPQPNDNSGGYTVQSGANCNSGGCGSAAFATANFQVPTIVHGDATGSCSPPGNPTENLISAGIDGGLFGYWPYNAEQVGINMTCELGVTTYVPFFISNFTAPDSEYRGTANNRVFINPGLIVKAKDKIVATVWCGPCGNATYDPITEITTLNTSTFHWTLEDATQHEYWNGSWNNAALRINVFFGTHSYGLSAYRTVGVYYTDNSGIDFAKMRIGLNKHRENIVWFLSQPAGEYVVYASYIGFSDQNQLENTGSLLASASNDGFRLSFEQFYLTSQ